MKGQKVNCDKCKTEFYIKKLYARYLFIINDEKEEKIRQTYFECPKCKSRFHCFYDNLETMKIQKKIDEGKMTRKDKREKFLELQKRVKKFLEN